MKQNINDFLQWAYSMRSAHNDASGRKKACHEFYYHACRKSKLLRRMIQRVHQAQSDHDTAHETLLWLLSMREQIYESLFLLTEKVYDPNNYVLNWKQYRDTHKNPNGRTYLGRLLMEYAYIVVCDTHEYKESIYNQLEILRDNLIHHNRTQISFGVHPGNDLPAIYAALCQRYLWLVMRYFVEARNHCHEAEKNRDSRGTTLQRIFAPTVRFYRYSWKSYWARPVWEYHNRTSQLSRIIQATIGPLWYILPRFLFVFILTEIILAIGLPIVDRMLPPSPTHEGFFYFLQGQNQFLKNFLFSLAASLLQFVTYILPWLGKALSWLCQALWAVLCWLFNILGWILRILVTLIVELFSWIISLF